MKVIRVKVIKRSNVTGAITSYFIGFKDEDELIQTLAEVTGVIIGLSIGDALEVVIEHCPEDIIPVFASAFDVIFYDLRSALEKG